MNLRKLALACLMTLFIAAPAYAADIIVDGACSLHDAIIAANTDSPAGGCPAGSGADVLHYDVDGLMLTLSAPLPTITSNITLTSVRRELRGVISGDFKHAMFDVASGAVLTLERMRFALHKPGAGAYLVVRRGGQAIVKGLPGSGSQVGNKTGLMDSNEGLPCDNAIYNEGSLTVIDADFGHQSYYSGWGDERPLDPNNLDARAIINNGGTVSLHAVDMYYHEYDVACETSIRLASRVPAPECKLEPQLQAGDRAIRRGGSYSNLRAEAGISGERVGRIESGAVVNVMEGPVEAGGYNWYRVAADDELEGWVAEAPARSFNCAYYFVGFSGELPPAAPETIPERQDCDVAEPLDVGGYAIIAGSVNINYRAEAGLGGSRLGTLAPGAVLEVLDGPEEVDGYTWWQVGNVIQGIEGWLAEGGVVSSGDCLRWLLPLEMEEGTDEETDMDETEEMMDEDADESELEKQNDEDAEQSSE